MPQEHVETTNVSSRMVHYKGSQNFLGFRFGDLLQNRRLVLRRAECFESDRFRVEGLGFRV